MHNIKYIDYHCSTSEHKILKDVNQFAFDPEETSNYHGNIHFHRDVICKDRDAALKWIEDHDRGWYDDHAVFYKDGRKKFWLVKIEYHC